MLQWIQHKLTLGSVNLMDRQSQHLWQTNLFVTKTLSKDLDDAHNIPPTGQDIIKIYINLVPWT